MLDRCSIASRSIKPPLLWTPLDSSSIAISHYFNSQHLSIHRETEISIIKKFQRDFHSHFLWFLSIESLSSLSQTPQTKPFHLPHLIFGLNQVFFIWYDPSSLFYHAFHTFCPKFWVFEKSLGFFKFNDVFVKFLELVFV